MNTAKTKIALYSRFTASLFTVFVVMLDEVRGQVEGNEADLDAAVFGFDTYDVLVHLGAGAEFDVVAVRDIGLDMASVFVVAGKAL